MKKHYVSPELEIVTYTLNDVLVTSTPESSKPEVITSGSTGSDLPVIGDDGLG